MGRTKDLSEQLIVRMLGLAAMVIMALFMFGSMVLRADAATAKVTASSVNIRKEASTASEVVSSANSGDSFTIHSEVTGADGYVWYQISVNNQLGYIRSDLAQKSEDGSTITTTPAVSTENVTAVQPISAKVTGNSVRVRSAASTDVNFITTVARDVVVTVNGVAEGADGRTWYQVNFRADSGEVTGFIREDFLSLSGEVVPVVEETTPPETEDPSAGNTEDPSTGVVDDPVVTVKDYETIQEDGKWYLVDNVEHYKYVIADLFSATEANAKLYEDSQKTVRTQKIFIIILVLVIVAGGVGATLLIFKMKDAADEAYYDRIEKETVNNRQNKQNVMHTVGKDGNAEKKPTVNGQQRTVNRPQPANGQAKAMPKQQGAGGQARPNMSAPAAGGQARSGVKPQAAGNASAQSRTSAEGNAARPQGAGQPKPSAQSQAARSQGTAQPKPAETVKAANRAAKSTEQEWKSKNFMSDDDDDFEFEFLNWDGDEEL